MTILISLVGEQPAPNLLPLRHYDPDRVVLVHTRLDASARMAGKLARVIGSRVEQPLLVTDAYRVEIIKADLHRYLNDKGWTGDELIFNLTGGTKTMALAAYEVAREIGARAFYYQTEDNLSLLHAYRFEAQGLICAEIVPVEATLTLDDYLKLYVGQYQPGRLKEPLEILVESALRRRLPHYQILTSVHLQELAGNVEIDLMARHGNQVAVFEIKRQGKKGIDQLQSVTNQRTLGTYTRKILVSRAALDSNNQELAAAYRIKVVCLPDAPIGVPGSALSPADEDQLIRAVQECLEPR